MSIINCASCCSPVDTDYDVEGEIDGVDYCPECREKRWNNQEQTRNAQPTQVFPHESS